MEMHNAAWLEVNTQAINKIICGLMTIYHWMERASPMNFSSLLLREWNCILTEGRQMSYWGKKNKKTKQNTDSLFLWLICWFISRCEYDSMFVQDDVILNVDFFIIFFLLLLFFLSGVHTGLQHALLLKLATIGHCVWLWTMLSV